jgi:hypothetical protein
MPPDELSNQHLNDIGEPELPFLGGDPGEEDNLEKKIPEFFFQFVRLPPLDCLQDFIGFFDEVFFQGLFGLLPVPRASRGTAQPGHDSEEFIYGRIFSRGPFF